MEKRTDRLTAIYVDMAVNVAAVFGMEAGMPVLQHNTPLLVVHRVLVQVGPRRGASPEALDSINFREELPQVGRPCFSHAEHGLLDSRQHCRKYIRPPMPRQ
jgi:hypothetical protein